VPLNYEISEKAWTDKEVNLNHLHTFGYISYVHVELDRKSKLDPKSKRCIFIEYGTSEYGCRFWDPENLKILKHKNVVFNEKKMYKKRGALRRRISEWHLRAHQNSRMLRIRSSSNLMFL